MAVPSRRSGRWRRVASMGTRIEIVPAEAPADEPVAVRVRGVPAGQHVTLRAEARRGSEPAWRSQVEFLADESATVDLARQAPEAGSYQGIEPMGLFWSMLPEPAAPSLAEVYASLDPITVTLAA